MSFQNDIRMTNSNCAPLCKEGTKAKLFYYLPECCNLSEDIQQSLLTVTINGM